MAKSKKGPQGPPPPMWMVTFSDMVSLLLTFFVMLVSMSSTKNSDVATALTSIREALGSFGQGYTSMMSPYTIIPIPELEFMPQSYSSPDSLKDVKDYLKNENLNNKVQIIQKGSDLVIRFPDQVLFNSGQVQLLPESYPILNKVSELIKKLGCRARIEGYTDNRPISGETYKSNWELSTARSLNTLRYLVDIGGVHENLFNIIGYGEYKPLVPNTDPKSQTKNRRVEIVLLKAAEDLEGLEETIKDLNLEILK